MLHEPGAQEDLRLDALRHACGHADWEEEGFADRPARRFGILEASTLVAAGNLTDWRNTFSDIGLVTHPCHRGRGHARGLTRAMTHAALQTADLVRYRALTTNAASLAVAQGEGLAPHDQPQAQPCAAARILAHRARTTRRGQCGAE